MGGRLRGLASRTPHSGGLSGTGFRVEGRQKSIRIVHTAARPALICSRAGAGLPLDAASRLYGLLSFTPRPCAREPGPATPTRGAASPQAKAAPAQSRPDLLGLDALALAGGLDTSHEDRATGDGDRLASQGLAPVLDLEVAQSAGPAPAEPRSAGADCSNVA